MGRIPPHRGSFHKSGKQRAYGIRNLGVCTENGRRANLRSGVSAIWPLSERVQGHQQVTDAYLLGLAMHKKGKLGTMDRTVVELLPDKGLERNLVVMI